MASITQASLPTLDRLKASVPDDLDVQKVAQGWFNTFAEHVQQGNVRGMLDLMLGDAWWRDILALTWDFRTFYSKEKIRKFLADRLGQAQISSLKLVVGSEALQRLYPDLAWIQAFFTFDIAVGHALGIVRLVPTSSGEWKAHTILTLLEGLKGHPELVGSLREQQPNHDKWQEKRRREIECEDEDPKVIIIGAGQSGLDVAARLKYLGVKSLIIEREPRVGNLWRKRYEALCLHDTVYYDHMPYLPFPPTRPVSPAPKLADWLENYAHVMELDIWLSTNIIDTKQDPSMHKWTVTVRCADGTERTVVANHLVFAIGLGGGTLRMPSIPGAEEFQGKMLHSGQFTSGRDYLGKKVVIVGACTSSHDIAKDMYDHGVDVTLFQRSSTYGRSVDKGANAMLSPLYHEGGDPDIADRITASFPVWQNHPMQKRVVKDIAAMDKETLDGLRRVGFRNMGPDDSGFMMLIWQKGGGYYLGACASRGASACAEWACRADVGASQLIIDGKIKLKNDVQIKCFTKRGLEFENGSMLDADAVIFATGYGDPRDPIKKVIGEELGKQLKPI
ncbi:hypothetical protein EWM64_g1514 [Hericium alpestre]|uniref:FAD/NAD(P)-binding domain-containing protein n=1 Tax=Hericium alpestre TaxID=135208 RepID=A0A4Z0A662_9AGAM|nr:hypothetical protein EWM64_g1514 [Hericium alpestre]